MASTEGTVPGPAAASLESRRSALQGQVGYYLKQGYRVASQTDTSAQLVKPKKFSLILFILLLILAVFPAVVYVAYYVAKKDNSIYITVDEWGKVNTM